MASGGDIDFDQRITQLDQFLGGVPIFREGGSTSETELGWMVGGGLEYAVTDHWHVRAQYQFIDLGSADLDSHGVSIFPGAAGYTANHEAELREHNASFAIMFKF